MSLSRMVARNTLAQITSKALTSLIGLATRKLLTTYLGPSGFGDYFFALTYAGIFGSIADWGTIVIAVREVSQHPLLQPRIFGSAILGRLFLSVIAAVFAVLVVPLFHFSPGLVTAITISAVLIIVFALKASLGIIFEAKLQMHYWLLVEVSASLATLALFALAVTLHLGLIALLSSLFIATVISILIGFSLAKKITPIDFHLEWPLLKRLGLEALPMGGALIMFNIYNNLDAVILKLLRTSAEVGFYGLAYFIYSNVILVAAYLINATFPLFSREVVSGKPTPAFHNLYQKTLDIMLCFAILATTVTFIFSPLLVRIISSPQFTASGPLLRVLSLALFFSFLNHVTGFGLIALGKQRQYLFITVGALILNAFTNIIYIPLYGALASAWITVATEAFVQITGLILISHYLKKFPSFFSFPKTAVSFITSRGKIF